MRLNNLVIDTDTNDKVKASSTDLTANYLNQKITDGDNTTWGVVGGAGTNQLMELDLNNPITNDDGDTIDWELGQLYAPDLAGDILKVDWISDINETYFYGVENPIHLFGENECAVILETTTGGDTAVLNLNSSGRLAFQCDGNGLSIDGSLTIGSTTLTEQNLIDLLALL